MICSATFDSFVLNMNELSLYIEKEWNLTPVKRSTKNQWYITKNQPLSKLNIPDYSVWKPCEIHFNHYDSTFKSTQKSKLTTLSMKILRLKGIHYAFYIKRKTDRRFFLKNNTDTRIIYRKTV